MLNGERIGLHMFALDFSISSFVKHHGDQEKMRLELVSQTNTTKQMLEHWVPVYILKNNRHIAGNWAREWISTTDEG